MQFPPTTRHLLGHHQACGEEVADHLNELFERHGPPLFLKRDNCGNLNHHLVDRLLEAFLVIPVNSPCYYPQYNGGIEAAQREIKAILARRTSVPYPFLGIQAQLDVQALNHKPRRCLHRRTPCQVFLAGSALARTFTKPKRREVYEQITDNTIRLIESDGRNADEAWRLAVETWLLDKGFITAKKGRKCYPFFRKPRSH